MTARLSFLQLMRDASGYFLSLVWIVCDERWRLCFTIAHYYILQSSQKIKRQRRRDPAREVELGDACQTGPGWCVCVRDMV